MADQERDTAKGSPSPFDNTEENRNCSSPQPYRSCGSADVEEEVDAGSAQFVEPQTPINIGPAGRRPDSDKSGQSEADTASVQANTSSADSTLNIINKGPLQLGTSGIVINQAYKNCTINNSLEILKTVMADGLAEQRTAVPINSKQCFTHRRNDHQCDHQAGLRPDSAQRVASEADTASGQSNTLSTDSKSDVNNTGVLQLGNRNIVINQTYTDCTINNSPEDSLVDLLEQKLVTKNCDHCLTFHRNDHQPLSGHRLDPPASHDKLSSRSDPRQPNGAQRTGGKESAEMTRNVTKQTLYNTKADVPPEHTETQRRNSKRRQNAIAKESSIFFDKKGKVLEPGDAVWVTGHSGQRWAVFVGNQQIVRCDRSKETVIKEHLDSVKEFGKLSVRRGKQVSVSQPDVRIQKAESLLGKKFRSDWERDYDFVAWVFTGLTMEEAQNKGFEFY